MTTPDPLAQTLWAVALDLYQESETLDRRAGRLEELGDQLMSAFEEIAHREAMPFEDTDRIEADAEEYAHPERRRPVHYDGQTITFGEYDPNLPITRHPESAPSVAVAMMRAGDGIRVMGVLRQENADLKRQIAEMQAQLLLISIPRVKEQEEQ